MEDGTSEEDEFPDSEDEDILDDAQIWEKQRVRKLTLLQEFEKKKAEKNESGALMLSEIEPSSGAGGGGEQSFNTSEMSSDLL